jgi:16S rRNA (uracil1498-N3)-methyltransferase
MLPRFYAPNAGAAGPNRDVEMPAEEGRHAIRVLRLRPGDDLAIFDGCGHEWRARIASTSRSRVVVQVVEPIAPSSEPRVRVILFQSVLKGDHMDSVVRDATMLGVSEVRPVISEHTVVSPKAASSGGALTRWLRVAIASAKQCRRSVVPLIRPAVPLGIAVQDAIIAACDARIVLAEPLVRTGDDRSSPRSPAPGAAALAVGPEGGWSAQELVTFERAGFVALTLGALTLRADAAATVAISVLRERWGDL